MANDTAPGVVRCCSQRGRRVRPAQPVHHGQQPHHGGDRRPERRRQARSGDGEPRRQHGVGVARRRRRRLRGRTPIFAAGSGPARSRSVDLNGDGRPDLAVANSFVATVAVLFGDGTGGFGPNVDVPAGDVSSAIRIDDLNCDGKLDLIVANQNSSAGRRGCWAMATEASGLYPVRGGGGPVLDCDGRSERRRPAPTWSRPTTAVAPGVGAGRQRRRHVLRRGATWRWDRHHRGRRRRPRFATAGPIW